mgnify:CR=1 FL=1
MKNFIQSGHIVTLPAPYAVNSGDGVLVGSIFGISAITAAAGDSIETGITGIYDIKKTSSQAWSIGDKIYWDNTAREATKTATNNTLIGTAIDIVGNTAAETIGRVRLNGSC